MKIHYKTVLILTSSLTLITLLAFSGLTAAVPAESQSAANNQVVIDDFSDAANNNFGIARQFMNDTIAGGNTITEQKVSGGILQIKGEIVPPRGQPGWASSVLLLDPQGQPWDASKYQGIRLLIKVNKGNISLSANSIDVSNFDYHAAHVIVPSDGQFHEVKIPFNTMTRAWSEQTPLNPQTINSLSIVAYDIQKSKFDFTVDNVSFY